VVTIRDILSPMRRRFGISKEDSLMIRFIDLQLMKFVTRSDHPFFCLPVSALSAGPDQDLVAPEQLQQEFTFIVQVGKPSIITAEHLGLKPHFEQHMEQVQNILRDKSASVMWLGELATYVSEEKFQQMKEEFESETQIASVATKVFFSVEAHISALDYCFDSLNQIFKQKYD
jgi:hypothetical protein